MADFLSGNQPAYAGAGPLQSGALNTAAVNNNYSRNQTSNVSNVSTPVSVNVNVSGMSPDMAQSMVEHAIEDAFKNVVDGARGSIPLLEARRG